MFRHDHNDFLNQRTLAAKNFFEDIAQFQMAVATSIFPALVLIETRQGRVGMGFFQYESWLVSNAHVIREEAEIEDGLTLRRYDNTRVDFEVELAFLRPWLNKKAPDLAIIKTHSPSLCVPQLPFSADDTYQRTRYFYVDQYFVVHPLLLVSPEEQVPMQFCCEDGEVPQLGSSGAPVFSAKVILGRQNRWIFAVVGAIYARCNAKRDEASVKLVCAVPIREELKQIRQILIQRDFSTYFQKRGQSSVALGDAEGVAENTFHFIQEKELAAAGIKAFQSGDGCLDMTLPKGLEPLAGSTLVRLKASYLPTLGILSDVDAVIATFKTFISDVENMQSITLRAGDRLLEDQYWRVDCKPSNVYWVLQLQDNTGKGVKVPGTDKSASSIFAEVKILKTITAVNGRVLGQDLLKSQALVEEKASMVEALAQAKGNARKELVQQIDHMDVYIVAGQPPSCATLEEYQLVVPIRAETPKSLSLFVAIEEDAPPETSFSTISALMNDAQRLNTVNDEGDTPLMVLLKDPALQEKGTQMAKASMLALKSFWTQANHAGQTAETLLPGHPEEVQQLRPHE